ncbi:MAG: ATP-binding cassette domain-containing protein, partial [Paracoccaceae bacterium]|nr:ATP-binding cassette domain-containing protein [Paracoccaceae bacterium]
RVGLADRINHFPAELSGGEQQRVAIARAIAKRPDVLLCDEPTGALDSQTGVVVLQALYDINRDLGTVTALITHNAAIRNIAHRVIYLADGQILRTEENASRAAPSEVTW